MARTEFILAVMLLLFGAFLLGFLTHWIVTRLSRVSDAELGQLDSMAEDLHRAEEARDAARSAKERQERELGHELGALRSELATLSEALISARDEASELRGYIETHSRQT